MIAGLRGILESIGIDYMVLEVSGVSYKVSAPSTTISRLPGIGKETKVFTHLHVREDILALFGFFSRSELEMFEVLIGVSGIGPKAALNILSAASAEDLSLAISAGNTEFLTRIPGIGKKTAGRLVLELRGKIDFDQLTGGSESFGGGNPDVVAALTGLGYSTSEISSALKNLTDAGSLPVEEQIRLALQHFASTR